MKCQFYGITDERFTYYNLAFQPIPLVLGLISAIEKQQINKTNLNAKTNAIGWSFLVNSFSEKSKINYVDLLPLPDDTETNQKVEAGFNKPTKYTLGCISRLISQDRIPYQVLVSLAGTGVLTGM